MRRTSRSRPSAVRAVQVSPAELRATHSWNCIPCNGSPPGGAFAGAGAAGRGGSVGVLRLDPTSRVSGAAAGPASGSSFPASGATGVAVSSTTGTSECVAGLGRAPTAGGGPAGASACPVRRASTKAVQDGKRQRGSLDRARAVAARSASGSAPRSGSACMCCRAIWRKFLPLNGIVPVSSSQ